MKEDQVLRQHIANLLKGGQAFAPFDAIVADFPQGKINNKFPNGSYSAWQLLEHIRRTQEDILDYVTNPSYIGREWPKDYWPDSSIEASEKDWRKTISSYKKDVINLIDIVTDPKVDLFSYVPSSTQHTYLREFLLIGEHSAYHLGEFSIMRQVMNTWSKKHTG